MAVEAAEARFLSNLQQAHKPSTYLAQFQIQYGGSFLAVISDPACSRLIRQASVDGVPHALLMVDRLAAESPGGAPVTATAAAAAPAQAALALPLPLPLPPAAAAPAARSSSQGAPGAAPAVDAVAARLAALRLAAGDRLPTPQLVTSEAAAAAAVERLLAVPEVAVDCEGELDRAGPIALVQLYAPEAAADGGSACYVFDLLAMPEAERPGAMRHLRRLLESGDVTKVRVGGCGQVGGGSLVGVRDGLPGCLLGSHSNCWLLAAALQCEPCLVPPTHPPAPRRCCTTAGRTARRCSTCGACAARRCGTRRWGWGGRLGLGRQAGSWRMQVKRWVAARSKASCLNALTP